jgi:spermidine/putrescine transport system substrate-binding protein
MDEYKAKKIQFRRLPVRQSIEQWNDVWSEFKAA